MRVDAPLLEVLDEEVVALCVRVRLCDIPIHLLSGQSASPARFRSNPATGSRVRVLSDVRRGRAEQPGAVVPERVPAAFQARDAARSRHARPARCATAAAHRVEQHRVGFAVPARAREDPVRPVRPAHEGRRRVLVDRKAVAVQHGVQDRVLEARRFGAELGRVTEKGRGGERKV